MIKTAVEQKCPDDTLQIVRHARILAKQKFQEAVADGGKGLRVDLDIRFPDDGGRVGTQVWGDVTSIHSSCSSIRKDAMAFFREEATAAVAAIEELIPNSFEEVPSPGVREASKRKVKKYDPMVILAKKQVDEKSRAAAPVFFPLVVSHLGEMCPSLIKLIEWFATTLKARAMQGLIPQSVLMGTEPSVFSARFRTRAKDRLMAALISGWGRQLRSVGFPKC
jgi:hypothetical protein